MKILVPLDGSKLAERALEQAETFAKPLQAEVILTRIVSNPMAGAPETGPAVEEKIAGETMDQAQDYLNGIVLRLKGKGITARGIVQEGIPYSAILGLAHNEDVDYIVMSTHGRTGLSKMILGSVAEKVLFTTKRPVLLVKPERIHKARVDEAEVIVSMH